MAHLPSGSRLALAVDVHVRAALGDELGPTLDVRADEIVHDGAAAHQAGQARRKVADCADVLLELRGDRAFDRPVAAVVDARRDLVDQRPVVAGEEFDREHADVAERLGDAQRCFARFGDLHGSRRRCTARSSGGGCPRDARSAASPRTRSGRPPSARG